jgi:multidrug efflux pump subunit AcrB
MQKLAEICVRRPVFATMLIAALTVIGGVSFFVLGVDRYPRIDIPVVSVNTTNPGATPESVETEITDRIEAAVNTVAGIDELRSSSSEGSSRVTITFDLSKNPDVAAQEVRAKVDPVIRDLPETSDPPIVQKQDPDSTPVILYSISGPMPVTELTTYIEQNVQKRLESVAERLGTTVEAVAVRWVLEWEGVTGAIVGARSPEQVDGWIGAASLGLSDKDLDDIATAIIASQAGTGRERPRLGH